MNLQRIIPKNSDYMVLNKISDFKGLYLCMDYKDVDSQKINTGAFIDAFPFKNINQFKGTRPFFIMSEERIIENVVKGGGIYDKYDVSLHVGSVVDYAGLTYTVVGYVVNTYAQWNMPTPLLLNPKNIVADYKSLFQGKLTDYQINEKINDNFQEGKYDADMLIPLVDGNDYKDDILVIEKKPLEKEVLLFTQKVAKQKNVKVKVAKNVFIDTILDINGDEIQKIREVDSDLYDKTRNFINSVNDIINKKIETPKVKQVEQQEEVDLSFLDELDDVFTDNFLQQIDTEF